MLIGKKVRVILYDAEKTILEIWERSFNVRKDGNSKQLTDVILDAALQMNKGDKLEVIFQKQDGTW